MLTSQFPHHSLFHVKPQQYFSPSCMFPIHTAVSWCAPEDTALFICAGSTWVTHWQGNDVTGWQPCCRLWRVVCFSDASAESGARFLEALNLLVSLMREIPGLMAKPAQAAKRRTEFVINTTLHIIFNIQSACCVKPTWKQNATNLKYYHMQMFKLRKCAILGKATGKQKVSKVTTSGAQKDQLEEHSAVN